MSGYHQGCSPLKHPQPFKNHNSIVIDMAVSLSGIFMPYISIYSYIQEELDSMPEMHPTVIKYKEFNKSFKLQYYIPVCCLLLYIDCGYNICLAMTSILMMADHRQDKLLMCKHQMIELFG